MRQPHYSEQIKMRQIGKARSSNGPAAAQWNSPMSEFRNSFLGGSFATL